MKNHIFNQYNTTIIVPQSIITALYIFSSLEEHFQKIKKFFFLISDFMLNNSELA